MNIVPLLGPLADMLKSKKAIALVVALLAVSVLCYLGKIDAAAMLDFAKWLVGSYMVAEGVAKIGSPTSADTTPSAAGKARALGFPEKPGPIVLSLDRDTQPTASPGK